MPTLTSSDTLVNDTTVGPQFDPVVAALSNGNWITAWASSPAAYPSPTEIHARLFSADGSSPGADMVINPHLPGSVEDIQAQPLNGGGFLISWTQENGSNTRDIYEQAFNAAGSPASPVTLVNTTTAHDQRLADTAALAGGGSVDVWYSAQQDATNTGHGQPSPTTTVLTAQILDSTGAKVGGEIALTPPVPGTPYLQVAGLADGGFVAIWNQSDGGGYRLVGQRFDGAGHPQGQQLALEGAVGSPDVAGLSDGSFVVSFQTQPGELYDVNVQHFAADGQPIGPRNVVQSDRFSQQDSHVTALPGGGYAVSFWSEASTPDGNSPPDWHLYVQRFDNQDHPVGGALQLDAGSGVEGASALAANAAGQLVALWDHVAGGDVDIHGRLVAANAVGTTDPNAGRLIVSPDAGSTLHGGAGDDTLIASQGPDVLSGGAGADRFLLTQEPWAPIHITDFAVGTDRLDLKALFEKAGYTGSDPVGAGYVKLLDDGNGGTEVFFDPDGPNPAHQWPDNIIDLEHVPVSSVTWFDLIAGAAPAPAGETTVGQSPPPPPPTSPPPVSPPPAGGGVQTGHDGGSNMTGGSGDDTLIGGTSGPDTMTGAGGGDHFQFDTVPWQAATITDFTHGADKIDVSHLLAGVGYSGSDPIADGYIKFGDDGQGNTWVYFDRDGSAGTGDQWGTRVATLSHVSASSLTASDWIFRSGGGSPPPPPPPPPSGGQVFAAHDGGTNLTGTSGDDTLIGAHGQDTMTGGAGADHFTWNDLPWAYAQITDFAPGADKIDVAHLLAGVGYSGSDPIADGYIKFGDDGQGNTWVYFDRDGAGSGDQWGTHLATLQHVQASSISAGDFLFH